MVWMVVVVVDTGGAGEAQRERESLSIDLEGCRGRPRGHNLLDEQDQPNAQRKGGRYIYEQTGSAKQQTKTQKRGMS